MKYRYKSPGSWYRAFRTAPIPQIGSILRIGSMCLLLMGQVYLSDALAEPRFEKPTLYLDDDTLMMDLSLDSLFSQRASDAIASGMTTSIAYDILLEPVGPARPIRRALSLRLDHDIWEGRYQVVRRTATQDTLITESLEEATRFCSTFSALPIAPLPDDSVPFVLRIRTIVNPISPEQKVKTRKWLNLLERGSVLELFFSFEPKDDEQNWVEIARFRKRDLPSEVSPTLATPDTEDASP